MREKIDRSAFLFLEPGAGKPLIIFAQCIDCRMFVGEEYLAKNIDGSRCILHGSFVSVDGDDSCGLMVSWPTPDGAPNVKVVKDHAGELNKMITGSVTPEESGLVSRQVRCENCFWPSNKEVTKCGLYETLNKLLPNDFALDPNITPHACCNAQTPMDGDDDGDDDDKPSPKRAAPKSPDLYNYDKNMPMRDYAKMMDRDLPPRLGGRKKGK